MRPWPCMATFCPQPSAWGLESSHILHLSVPHTGGQVGIAIPLWQMRKLGPRDKETCRGHAAVWMESWTEAELLKELLHLLCHSHPEGRKGAHQDLMCSPTCQGLRESHHRARTGTGTLIRVPASAYQAWWSLGLERFSQAASLLRVIQVPSLIRK